MHTVTTKPVSGEQSAVLFIVFHLRDIARPARRQPRAICINAHYHLMSPCKLAAITPWSFMWAVDGGHWTVGVEQWAVDGGHWTVGVRQWAVDGGRWALDSGRCAASVGQRKGGPSPECYICDVGGR